MRSKRRIPTVAPQTRPNSEINVTPLVDVVLVLLIIFMVVTPLLEKMLGVKIPDAEQVELQEAPPPQLVVSVSPAGELAINTQPVPPDEYVERLRRIIAAQPAGERLVFFVADEVANYAKVVAALDGARAAGAETLGMMTEVMPVTPVVPAAPPPPP
jgi:biopolymer transport protein ExbD